MVANPLTVAVESVPSFPASSSHLERAYTNEQSAFLDVGDSRVHYRSEGSPDGRTVLLLHGTYSSLHTWDEWVEALGDAYHLVRLDMPGFGLTGPRDEGEHTLEYLVETVGRFCDELGLSEVVVAGNSLGGGVAWRLQTRRPELVAGLVLLDAGGSTLLCRIIDSLTSPLLLQYALSALVVRLVVEDAYAADNSPSRATVRRYYDLMRYPGNRPAVRELARTYRRDYPGNCGERHLVPRPPAWHEPVPGVCDPHCIDEVDVPTLFQWGEEDDWLPTAFGRHLADEIPDSQFLTYDGVGHVPMEEAPARTAADARVFLDALDP